MDLDCKTLSAAAGSTRIWVVEMESLSIESITEVKRSITEI